MSREAPHDLEFSEVDQIHLDQILDRLQANKNVWAQLPIPAKIDLLQTTLGNLRQQADLWIEAANNARQIAPDSVWAAEEWYEVYSLARALRGYADTLRAMMSGKASRPGKVWVKPGGQVVARVFPYDLFDWLMFNGITADVWMQPDVTLDNLPQQMGAFYRQKNPVGYVALVLGAGNVNSIPPLDVLHQLLNCGQVVLLKLSPVNAYLKPILAAVFASFIDRGYLAIVTGGEAVGRYLSRHTAVSHIHVTGSNRTYDALMRENKTGKPITAELGGVTPLIVLPGNWKTADLRYQAENVVTMKLFNGGFNCIAVQVLVLPESWSQRDAFLDMIREQMRLLPPQPTFYPCVEKRQRAVQTNDPEAELLGGDVPRTLIPNLPADVENASWQCEEFFGPMLAVTSLSGDTPDAFLRNAVAFCNERLSGSLGADIIVHPQTLRKMRDEVETAVSTLNYGIIGVNAWCGVAFRLIQPPWGAFQLADGRPGESGVGVVHNSLLFDRPQKTVMRGSFYPFPRTWLHGDPCFFPKPPWFLTHRFRQAIAQRVTRFMLNPGYRHLPGILAYGLRG